MTTPEQKARELHDRISIRHAHHKLMNPSDEQLQELANLIAERDALKAELAAIKGAGEPVAWSVTMNGAHTGNICGDQQEAIDLMNSLNHNFPFDKRAVAPLYTRPCVPLTDEHVRDFVNDVGLDWQSGWTLDECEPNRYVQLSRAVEAHIKGAKP